MRSTGTIRSCLTSSDSDSRMTNAVGWVNRHQAQVMDYLVEENRVLKEQIGKRRLRLTDDQRRRLAAKGKILGHRVLARIATIVTPNTIMRWHRRLIAMTWTHPNKRVAPGPSTQVNSITHGVRDSVRDQSPRPGSWPIRGHAPESENGVTL